MTDRRKEITKEGLQNLKEELKKRKNKIRKELQDELDEEMRAGDISENTSYYRVQEEIASNDKRIEELEEVIKNTKVVEKPSGSQKGQAGIGSTIVVQRDGQETEYRLVGATEADPTENKISVDSPIGSALAEAKAGDTVTVKTPAGPIEYGIMKVE
jgi:transcription elongation factor GreA